MWVKSSSSEPDDLLRIELGKKLHPECVRGEAVLEEEGEELA